MEETSDFDWGGFVVSTIFILAVAAPIAMYSGWGHFAATMVIAVLAYALGAEQG